MKAMKEFTPRIQKNVLGAASRKAMKQVEKIARAKLNAQTGPEATGALAKAIVTRTNARQGRRQGGVVTQVGIKGGAKQYVDDSRNRRAGRVGQSYEQGGKQFYFRFLEFGTSKMRARPFLRPALEENQGRVTQVLTDELKKGIARTAQRLAKR
jgi:HK97 gp10 family phage protein